MRICWYFVDIREVERKKSCVEELEKKGKDMYSVWKQRKKKMDAETEFIFEVAKLEDLWDDRYRVSNIEKSE